MKYSAVFNQDGSINCFRNGDSYQFVENEYEITEAQHSKAYLKLVDGEIVEDAGLKATWQEGRIKQIDAETHGLIKSWCSTQDEGCEEAFINLGIADKTDARYVAYIAQKDSIIDEQYDKKVSEGLI